MAVVHHFDGQGWGNIHRDTLLPVICVDRDANETFAFKTQKQICHITRTINLRAAAQTTIRGERR